VVIAICIKYLQYLREYLLLKTDSERPIPTSCVLTLLCLASCVVRYLSLLFTCSETLDARAASELT
jgi:hypothetical protein